MKGGSNACGYVYSAEFICARASVCVSREREKREVVFFLTREVYLVKKNDPREKHVCLKKSLKP